MHNKEIQKQIKEFLSQIAHDLCTPLTGVIGMAQLIKDHSHDPNFVAENAALLLSACQKTLVFRPEVH